MRVLPRRFEAKVHDTETGAVKVLLYDTAYPLLQVRWHFLGTMLLSSRDNLLICAAVRHQCR